MITWFDRRNNSTYHERRVGMCHEGGLERASGSKGARFGVEGSCAIRGEKSCSPVRDPLVICGGPDEHDSGGERNKTPSRRHSRNISVSLPKNEGMLRLLWKFRKSLNESDDPEPRRSVVKGSCLEKTASN